MSASFLYQWQKIDVDYGGRPNGYDSVGLRSAIILPHAIAQIFRFTNVDNAPRRILHEIDAGVREALNLLTYIQGFSQLSVAGRCCLGP